MKKIVIGILLIFFIVLSQKWMFNKIYSSKGDKLLANNIENAVYIISRDKVSDYNASFTVPNVEMVCFGGSLYSLRADQILKEVYPEYKYAPYLEIKKHSQRGGEGASLLMLLSKDNLIPIFISLEFFDIEFSKNLKPLNDMNNCYKTTDNKVSIDIKKLNGPRRNWWDEKIDQALITIK